MSYPLVIANWKMNLPTEGISGWIQNEMLSNNEKVDFDNNSSYFKFIGIAPPISHLSELKDQFNFGFLGAQDISRFDDGSKTGAISADMIIEKGCSFSIIGHSERREFHNETNNFMEQYNQSINSQLYNMNSQMNTFHEQSNGGMNTNNNYNVKSELE